MNMNWFKKLKKRRAIETPEEMFSESAILAIIAEYDKAVTKHPFFAHTAFEAGVSSASASALLRQHRSDLAEHIANRTVSGVAVLECELSEAREAFSQGDYANCYQELAQVGGVVVRMMLDVERKMRLQWYTNAERGGFDPAAPAAMYAGSDL